MGENNFFQQQQYAQPATSMVQQGEFFPFNDEIYSMAPEFSDANTALEELFPLQYQQSFNSSANFGDFAFNDAFLHPRQKVGGSWRHLINPHNQNASIECTSEQMNHQYTPGQERALDWIETTTPEEHNIITPVPNFSDYSNSSGYEANDSRPVDTFQCSRSSYQQPTHQNSAIIHSMAQPMIQPIARGEVGCRASNGTTPVYHPVSASAYQNARVSANVVNGAITAQTQAAFTTFSHFGNPVLTSDGISNVHDNLTIGFPPAIAPSAPQTVEGAHFAAQTRAACDSSSQFGDSVPATVANMNTDETFPPSSLSSVPVTRKKSNVQRRKRATRSQAVIPCPTPQPAGEKASKPEPPPLGSDGLRYPTLAAAMAAIENRSTLNISGDDWQAVNEKPAPHVLQIVNAFNGQTVDCPHDHALSASDQARWVAFQQVHLHKVAAYHSKDETKIEQAAWLIFGLVIEVHKDGYKEMKQKPSTAKCSEHIRDIAQTIQDYAIIRWDVIRHQRIEDLVTSTKAVITRKWANFNGNTHKKARDENNAVKAKDAGFAYDRVLGSKRKSVAGEQARGKKNLGKRKRAAEDEPDAEDEGEPETEESLLAGAIAKPKRKRVACGLTADIAANDEAGLQKDMTASHVATADSATHVESFGEPASSEHLTTINAPGTDYAANGADLGIEPRANHMTSDTAPETDYATHEVGIGITAASRHMTNGQPPSKNYHADTVDTGRPATSKRKRIASTETEFIAGNEVSIKECASSKRRKTADTSARFATKKTGKRPSRLPEAKSTSVQGLPQLDPRNTSAADSDQNEATSLSF